MTLHLERPAADRRATRFARGLLAGGALAIASCLAIGIADAQAGDRGPGRGPGLMRGGPGGGGQFSRGPGGPGERRGPPPGMGGAQNQGGQHGMRPLPPPAGGQFGGQQRGMRPPPPQMGGQQSGGEQRPVGAPARWRVQSRNRAAGSS